MNAARILILASRTWLATDAAGMIVARGEAAKTGAARTVLVIPGAEVTVRWIALKAAGLDQAAAAAALMLEDEVSAPRESLHFAAGEAGADGRRCVAIITRTKLQTLLEEAKALGCTPDVVAPDCLMLPEPATGLIAAEIGGMLAVRGRELAFTAEPDLAGRLAGGRAMETVAAEGLIAASAAAGAPVNLLQGAFGVRGNAAGRWRLTALLAGLAILSPVTVEGAYIVRDFLRADQLSRQAAAVEAGSAARWPGDPDNVRRLVGSYQAGQQFLALTAALFDALEKEPGLKVQILSFHAPKAEVRLVHQSYSDLGALTGALKARGVEVSPGASTEAGGQIASDLTLRLRE